MLCRLCVYELNENANALDSNLKKLVSKYLYIEITQNDELQTVTICRNCQQRLEDFDEFFKLVEERQKELQQFYINEKAIDCKSEIIDTNSDNSLAENATEQLDFLYAACDDQAMDETFDEDKKEDVLLLLEQEKKPVKTKTKAKTKTSIARKSSKSKVKKKTAATRRKSERKNSKEISEVNEETPKRPAVKQFTREEMKERDELITKYIAFVCELCQDRSENYKQFLQHFQKVHNQKAYIICCGKRLNSRCLIYSHVQYHINPDLFKCQLCNKMLKTTVSLQNHMNLRHNRTNLKNECNICGKKFSYPSMLDKHMSVHEKERNFICEFCQKGFKSKIAVDWHTKHMHGENILHICDICGKEYRYKISFDQHVAEHHGMATGQRKQCHICQVYVASNYYKRHLQRHQEVDVACDVCGQKFTTLPKLASHKERHHKALKKLDCPYCDKTFVRPRYLKEHIDLHTGHKEYSCKYCPREFRSKANMYAHSKKMHYDQWAEAQLKRTQPPAEVTATAEVKNEDIETLVATA